MTTPISELTTSPQAAAKPLALLPSLAVLLKEYRPTMDIEVVHDWSSDLIAAVIIEKARHLLKQRYPAADEERLLEIEDEEQLSWSICLKAAAEALPLNNYAAKRLPAPLPEIYEAIDLKHAEALIKEGNPANGG